ncbi:hypothetical protein [Pseudomonas oryzihabitans]|uniref:hypothetical protein n=1 Tax=Pseudomonas oryzihabitans TaxID=47885 RepID=UPI0011157792|nr:hypothetical protein [Pseudomonas psychrotolerans]
MSDLNFDQAILRYAAGERPFKLIKPSWWLLDEAGNRYPLKYIYAMAAGCDIGDTHTHIAAAAAQTAGFEVVNLNSNFSTGAAVHYWWVNHKQTWKAEYEHGYIWSPTANKNGATNQTYLNLKLVRPGDLVFSYAGGVVRGIGVATGTYINAEIPDEHWQAEEGWLKAGWSVPISWFTLAEPWSPKSYFSEIRHLLPEKHSPLQHKTGNGNQGCYLADVSSQFGEQMLALLRAENAGVVAQVLAIGSATKADFSSRPSAPITGRLPSEQLRKVTPDFIWPAVQQLLQGTVVEGFSESTDYDLLADGVRLAPKQVFALAGTTALGFQLKPSHFTAWKGSLCFALLEAAGYQIVPKGESPKPLDLPLEPEDREWVEGEVKLVAHLKRERSTGLAHAKREAFRKQHGRLFCETCGLDPVKEWGVIGEACIEVHHDSVHVAEMLPGHKTSLDHLKCLCELPSDAAQKVEGRSGGVGVSSRH